MFFKQLRNMIPPLPCHADTILDHIITQMDGKGISDKKLRKAVAKVKEESVPKMKEYEEKLESIEAGGRLSQTRDQAKLIPTAAPLYIKKKEMTLLSSPLLYLF